ncbi:hypothetical protein BKA56DRAFT_625954 [Ilyonectria sp. MPI-CAGE-AT-0026]|nr:hypothetical protein BKA56DRAFT_625954 [Ilyonectria sp. MPI-CAGE-AT-0026]
MDADPCEGKIDEVKPWIRRKVTPSNKITSIEVAQNSNSKYLRGHPFVIFETAEGASNSIELLNKSCFESRRITAHLTFQGPTEGEAYKEPHESRDPPTSKAEPIVGPSRLTDDQLYGERSHHSKHNDSDKKRSSNGTSSSSRRTNPQSGKKSSSKKRTSLDKMPDNDPGQPIVVNGSSRRRDQRW